LGKDKAVAKRLTVRWSAQVELSAARAALVVATGARCIDLKTEQLLVPVVTEINNRLLSGSLDMSVFWEQYLDEVLRESEATQACAAALIWAGCSEMQVEQTAKAIASRMSDARRMFLQRFPKLSEQLELRARPLRERWETYGQGLLREVGRQIWGEPPADWWPPSVTALMVQPMRGGDGGFDQDRHRFWMEAVLADIDPAVPEILRMTWLITRMAIDAHIRERSTDLSLAIPWSLASVPLVLAAGRELELVSGEPVGPANKEGPAKKEANALPIRRAMELWRFGDANTADLLSAWWQEFRGTNVPLPVALKILDQRLQAVSHPSPG
jgi:hypothetical protein